MPRNIQSIKVLATESGQWNVSIAVLDNVMVQIEVEEDKDTQRGKVKMSLADAHLP